MWTVTVMEERTMSKIVFKQTKAQERMVIMKDIIQQLIAGELVAQSGTYLNARREVRFGSAGGVGTGGECVEEIDAREALARMGQCEVCQRGAVVLAMIRRHDRLPLAADVLCSCGCGDGTTDAVDKIRRVVTDVDNAYVNQLFSATQLLLMEQAFEACNVFPELNVWRAVFPNDVNRMDAICRNVIEHKGTFVINDVPRKRRRPLSAIIAKREGA